MTRRRVSFTGSKSRKPMLIAGILLLVLIPAALLAARNPSKAQAQWFDTNWGYRTKIDVANSSGSTQTDFQVLVATDTATLVTAGKMQATCADLRVTDNSGKLLNYWIEPNTCNTTSTQIWVKVPSIPTSGIPIYLYYGNPSALPANYKTTDVFIKELSGSIASWPLDDTTTTQSYARVVNASTATGRNIVINGGFDADVSWTKQTGWTIANGVAHHDGSGSSNRSLYQTIPVIAGKYYSFTYTISNIQAGGSFVAYIQGTYGTTRTTNGTFTETILAGSTNANTNIVQQGSGAADIDNVAVTQVNVPSSGTTTNLLTDGNMETSGTSAYSPDNSPTLSKQTTSPRGGTQVLRVARNAGNDPGTYQTILTVGKVYRAYGYARSDGNATPKVQSGNIGGAVTLFTGTTSTTWQPFDVTFVANLTNFTLRCTTSTGTQYCDFDDVTVTEDTITRSDNIMQDADMEIVGTTNWATQGPTLSKVTSTPHGGTQALRITAATGFGSGNGAYQYLLATGKTYIAQGYYRTDGTASGRLSTQSTGFTLSNPASWTFFSVYISASQVTDPRFYLQGSGGASTNWVEYDDVTLNEISPFSGTFDATASKKPTLGSASGGHLSTAYSFNAANSQYVNIYSSDLNSAFNPSEGTMIAWAKVSGSGVWTDGANREIFRLSDGGSNLLDMEKGVSGNNTISYRAYFGGTNLSVAVGSLSSTGWFQVALTWSKSANQMKAYYNGSQTGSTQTGLGTWSANITNAQTIIGAATNTGSEPWSGLINDVHLYNRALTATEIASLYNGSVDLQAYTTSNYVGKELVRKFNSGVTTTLSYAEENSLGPVAYWKFDEGTGTSAKDSSSNGNNGTLAGTTKPAWQTEDQCISGKCLYFNGSTSYVDLGTSVGNYTDNFTVSAWVKTATNNTRILSRRENAAGTQYDLYIESGTGKAGFYNGTNTYSGTSNLTDNQWHFISWVISGTNSKIYVDGNAQATFTAGITAKSVSTLIGALNKPAPSGVFNGVIDEVKIYSYARTAAQVQADYNSRGSNTASGTNIGLQSTTFLNNGLVGYWKMDEATWSGTASEIVDSSGNGNHGTAQGPTNAKAYPTAGKFGNGGYFDGVDDDATISYSSKFDFERTDSFTLSFWTNANTNAGNPALMGHGAGTGYYLMQLGGNLAVFLRNTYGSNMIYVLTSSAPLNGSWKHVVVTYNGNSDASGIKIYVNGVSQTLSINTNNLTSTIKNGNGFSFTHPGAATPYFAGNLDEIRIYNRTLSPSEISQLYSWAPGPVGYWKFEEHSGTTANDNSGNGYTGTLNCTGGGCANPSWTTGKFGGALQFNGTTNRVSTTFTSQLKDFTVCAWFKYIGAAGNSAARIVDKNYVTGFWMGRSTSGAANSFGGGVLESSSPYGIYVTLPDNQWNYICSIRQGTTHTINGNGGAVTISNTVSSTPLDTSAIGIGAITNSGNYFPGLIDEVKVYNYARNQQQIVEDMNGGHPTGGSPVSSQIAYWKLDEGAGQTANNIGNGGTINGTLGSTNGSDTNDPTWKTSSDCKVNSCLSFDGSNDYVDMGNPSIFDFGTNDFSISTWIKPTTVTGNYNLIKKGTYGSSGYLIWISNGTVSLYTYDTSGTNFSSSTAVIAANTWTHVVFSISRSGTSKIYINGNSVTTTGTVRPGTLTSSSASFYLGGTNSAMNYYSGLIDEVKVYNSALTADQVRIDYNAGSSLNFGVGAASESASLSDGAGNPPIAYYDFEERSGTALVDKSGNNYAGTVTCTGGGCIKPIWTTGKVGSAMTFDGVDDYINLPVSSTFLPGANAPITVEGWFKPSAIGASNYTNRCVSIASGPTGSAFLLGFDNTNKAFFYTSSTATRTPFSANAVLNQWTHLAVAYNGTQIQLYRDGKPDGAPFNSTLSAGDSTTAKLGTVVTANNNWFAGQMDEVKIYNYARTASQIAYDYNRGGPVGWWQFDECQGSTLHDASGNGNDGTWAGGTSIGTCTTPSTAWGNGVTGKYNSSLAFNGTNDYLSLGNTIKQNTFTISAWIKPSRYGGGNLANGIFYQGTGATQLGTVFWVGTGGAVGTNTIGGRYEGGNIGYANANTITLNVWQHVVMVFNAGTATFYVNGVNAGSASGMGSGAPANNPAYIGYWYNTADTNRYFQGQIDDVRVFNYVLSPTQVKTLFNGGAAVKYGPSVGQP